MFNIYKHQENVRFEESQRLKDESYTKWLLRHQQLKNRSNDNMKKRVSMFVQKESINPSIVQDDHYKTWRYNKQFRDVEDSDKFIGFKTFRHKPNYQIGKHFNERERHQISHLAQKSKMLLVNNQIIPQQHKSRSLRSQGPLAPKHTYRQKKPDHQVLQPRMRYTNITDKQRYMQTSITYDNKFSNVYNGFSLNKSKIGNIKISPLKNSGKDYNIDMMSSTYSEHKKDKQKFYYSVDNEEEKQLGISKYQNFNGSKLIPENSLSKQKRQKAYFKTAKTMALYGDAKANELMISTQYDRKKDLTNINKNMNNQSFVKRPII